jgi:PKD domain-containing protein
MGPKMFIVFMLSRPCRASLLTALLISSVWVGACEKVPLLAPSGSTLTLRASATALPLNGTTQLVAQVIEPSGTPPHSGTTVSFTTTLGSVEPAEATTDSLGQVVVTFKAGTTNGTATIVAISGGASSTGVTVAVAAVLPTIVITPPTAQPSVGLPSAFTFAVTVPANGTVVKAFSVNWGDGTTQDLGGVSGNSVVSHIFHQAKVFTITATATDGLGNVVTVASSVTVVPTALTLSITAPATAPSAGLPAAFTIVPGVPASTGDSVKSVTLNWGDGGATVTLGAISSSTVITHVFQTAGSYVITGTITDVADNSLTVYTAVTVIPVASPTIIITPNVPTVHGNPVNFTVQVTPPTGVGIVSATISFGDGVTNQLGGLNGTTNISHVYATPGPYTITVTVVDTLIDPTTGLNRQTTGTTNIQYP